MTIRVKLDVAGFYFSIIREVDANTTLLGLMQTIMNHGVVQTTEGQRARFTFSTSGRPSAPFVSRIGITFLDPPAPRQTFDAASNAYGGFMQLQPGTYAAVDETRVLTAQGVAELTWQYYANAASFHHGALASVGRVLNREPSPDPSKRLVVPFSQFALKEDCLITWRLIAIMVAGDPLPPATT
jgi:hypothetical protein